MKSSFFSEENDSKVFKNCQVIRPESPPATFKMIIERIIKALLKSKLIYTFELIYSHGLMSEFIIFTDETLEPSSSWTSQIFGFEKVILFLSGNMF